MFNPFKNLFKREENDPETVLKEEVPEQLRIPERYRPYKSTTLKELAESGETFWKFTQSAPGLSHENLFAEYPLHEIVEAQDDDEWLSFVKSSDICKCIGYGDNLTRFCFDRDNKKFKEIEDDSVIIKGNGLGELAARKLIPEESFSLKEPETIAKLISLSDQNCMITLFYHPMSPIDKVLDDYGFHDSRDFALYIKDNYRIAMSEVTESLKENIYEVLHDWEQTHENSNPLVGLEKEFRSIDEMSWEIGDDLGR